MLHAETANGWAVGFWVALILSIVVFLAAIASGILLGLPDSSPYSRGSARHFRWRPVRWGIFWSLAVPAVIWGIFTAMEWPPFSMQYHTYQPVTFTVASTGSRFINDGNNSVTQRIALSDGTGRIYGCDDTRCATLKKGDVVTLMCNLEWEGNGVPGYQCNWGKLGRND